MIRIMLFIALMLSTQVATALSYTLKVSAEELQKKVSEMMPLEKKKFFVTIILSDPEVKLAEGSDRISIFSHIEVVAPGGIKGSGRAEMSGSLSYDSDKSEFFYSDPTVVSMQVDNIPESYLPKIKDIAQTIASNMLAKYPIYKLKDDNIKHKLAKSVLEAVSVKDKQLVVVLSLF